MHLKLNFMMEAYLLMKGSKMAKDTFENQMKKLEDIVDKLEKDDIDLDKSIDLYEEGLKLSKSLKEELSKFEKRIEELNKNE